MTDRGTLRAAAVCLLLVSAGCAAPVADDGAQIDYSDGSLPFAAGPVFENVSATLGADVPPPDRVRVVDDAANLTGSVTGGTVPRFWRIAGVHTDSGLSASAVDQLENGVTSSTGLLAVYPGETADASDRWVLAHELVHYVQFQQTAGARIAAAVPDSTDGRYVQRSVIEGTAVAATDAYIAAHAPDLPPNAAVYQDLDRALTPGSIAWHYNRAYIEGREYAVAQAAGPKAFGTLYDDPPRTSEQVIHDLPPTAEVPQPLNLTTGGDEWQAAATDRLGEAFVRTALAANLSVERASRAAAGWGNDSLVTFRRPDGGASSYAWVLRWDTASDADEFAAALGDSLSARGTALDDGGWQVAGVHAALHRPAARTTVLVAGTDGFVDETAVTAAGGVSVAPS